MTEFTPCSHDDNLAPCMRLHRRLRWMRLLLVVELVIGAIVYLAIIAYGVLASAPARMRPPLPASLQWVYGGSGGMLLALAAMIMTALIWRRIRVLRRIEVRGPEG